MLTTEQIAARLDGRFRLLTAGLRTTLPRHQTLRAVMDWSYDLLFEKERVLFRRLTVFARGFDLEAAEAVCGEQDQAKLSPAVFYLHPSKVLDLLSNLIGKSLVVADTQSQSWAVWSRQFGWPGWMLNAITSDRRCAGRKSERPVNQV